MIIYPFTEEINTSKSLTVAAMRLQEVFKVWGYDFPFGFFQALTAYYHERYGEGDVICIHPQAIANRVRIYPADNAVVLDKQVDGHKKQHSVVHADLAHLRIYVLED